MNGFLIAEDDLNSAKILLNHEPPSLRSTCFHCQQSVEKMLKAFFVWKRVPFEKTHDISYLFDLCEFHGLDIAFLKNKADILTSYAVEIRYPDDDLNLTKEEAQEAFNIAEIIYKFVINLLKV